MTTTLRNLPGRYIWAGLIALTLLVILGLVYWKNSESVVDLQPEGKAVFIRGGFFRQDEFTLTRNGNKWMFSNSSESGELILPFESPYNNSRTLLLDSDGKVYLLDSYKRKTMELRVVNGEWSYDASSHWQSIFDLGEDLPEP